MPNYMNPYIANAMNNVTQAISALNAMKFDYLTRQAREQTAREEREAAKAGTLVTDYIPLFREYAKERREYEPVLRGMEALAAESPGAVFNPAFMNILGTTQAEAETALETALVREKGAVETDVASTRITEEAAAREQLAQAEHERALRELGQEYRYKGALAEYETRARVAPESVGIVPDYDYMTARTAGGDKTAEQRLKDELALREDYTRAVADEYEALRRTREQTFSEYVRARDDLRLRGKSLKPYQEAYEQADQAFKMYDVQARTRTAAVRAMEDQRALENARALRALHAGPTGFGGDYGEDVDLNAGVGTQYQKTEGANPKTNPSVNLEAPEELWKQTPWYAEPPEEEEAVVPAPAGGNFYDPYGLGVPFEE